MMNANASSYRTGSVDRNKDPIWDTPVTGIHEQVDPWSFIGNSPRCGGWYYIHDIIARKIKNLSDREKARLTSWLIEQRRFGIECPEITQEVIELLKQRNNISVPDRADAILKYIESKTPKLDQGVIYACRDPSEESPNLFSQKVIDPFILRQINRYSLIAYSESIDYGELSVLLKYLQQRKWIEIQDVSDDKYYPADKNKAIITTGESGQTYSRCETYTKSCKLTVEGYARLAGIQETKTDSKKGFMAMWFNPSMDQAWREGFEPGIRDAGYEPVRIDETQHINKIEDEIIAEIRRSRFVVADLTHGKKGVRGGVYYEAGFARGLGIPVIFTCRKNEKKEDKKEDKVKQEVHFDVDHYNRIIWENPEDLRSKLAQRISAVIGDGPLRSRD